MKTILAIVLIGLVLSVPVQGEKLGEFIEVNNPNFIQISGGKIYVLEKANVYVYSLKDLTLIKKFGKQGNGPGELNVGGPVIGQMQLVGKHVCVNTFNKIVRFSLDGTFVDEARFPFIALQATPFGDGFAISKLAMSDTGANRVGVFLFPKSLENGKELYGRAYMDFRKTGKLELVPKLFMIRAAGDRLVMLDHEEGGIMKVFSKDGTQVLKAPLNIEAVKTTESFRAKLMEWTKSQPQFKMIPEQVLKMIYVPDVLPSFKNFITADGKIFVHTFLQKDGKSKLVVLDMKGKPLKNFWLEGLEKDIIMPAPYAYYQGGLYYLKENVDEEVIELHKVKLEF